MAEGVVDELEVVQVGEDQCRWNDARGARDLALQRGHETAPVDETGQLVGHRLPLNGMVEVRILERDRSL